MSQNFENHSRIDPLYHGLAAPLSLVALVAAGPAAWSFWNGGQGAAAVALLSGTVALLVTTINTRRYGLMLQDRIIAVEVAERYARLCGEPFAPLAGKLTHAQIVALRFASDEELPALARRAVEESLAPTAIKKAITRWRSDLRRV